MDASLSPMKRPETFGASGGALKRLEKSWSVLIRFNIAFFISNEEFEMNAYQPTTNRFLRKSQFQIDQKTQINLMKNVQIRLFHDFNDFGFAGAPMRKGLKLMLLVLF